MIAVKIYLVISLTAEGYKMKLQYASFIGVYHIYGIYWLQLKIRKIHKDLSNWNPSNLRGFWEKRTYFRCVYWFKAFDTVDHSILLRKLELYGITDRNYAWIKSYLSNRLQYIQINENSRTEFCVVKCGVRLHFRTTAILIIC